MSKKIDINQESKKQLWAGIEKFFLTHKSPTIFNTFKMNRHDDAFQQSLIAAAVDVVFVVKVAANSLRNVFNCDLALREQVNRGRVDNSLENELKLYLVNQFMDENLTKEQLELVLSTPMRGGNPNVYGNMRNNKTEVAQGYTDKEIKRFREIMAQFKRDYTSILNDKEFMNPDNDIEKEDE